MGDLAYLKLQPYRQTLLALKQSLKLSAKYYGPSSYKLELPPKSSLHLVFHVPFTQEKKIGDSISISTALPQIQDDSFIVAPERVL